MLQKPLSPVTHRPAAVSAFRRSSLNLCHPRKNMVRKLVFTLSTPMNRFILSSLLSDQLKLRTIRGVNNVLYNKPIP